MVSLTDQIGFLLLRIFIITRPDKRKYDGGWLNGKQHGRSTYTNNKGVVRIGLWENGKRIRWLSEQPEAAADKGLNSEKVSS